MPNVSNCRERLDLWKRRTIAVILRERSDRGIAVPRGSSTAVARERSLGRRSLRSGFLRMTRLARFPPFESSPLFELLTVRAVFLLSPSNQRAALGLVARSRIR